MIPTRSLFRSRWAALFWAAGICWSAIQFAGERKTDVDAANAADTNAAQASALAAEG
ncbi:hypothetical protein FHS31_002743 [Sphingomonas vulcanisoli]|uniref:Uncharacterized protein n=1 Tax=Sphingomonas vulcanisoli TaxID=1658060 RepID=A0ABX0TUI3_9SPHN|nr:hypothetical protein [Sphingomonas vulcanisoli]NIJ09111.1 hypothetical protein [Sphingomonas vulcanisoli]